MTMRVGLVGCVKSKLPHPAAANDLYVSPLYRGRRAFVERSCDRWFILSAKHGLVDPEAILAPYDQTLKDASERERRAWSAQVLSDLEQRLGSLVGIQFELHAGAAYRDHGLAAGLTRRGAVVSNPTQGLSMGRQIAFYNEQRDRAHSGRAVMEALRTRPPDRGWKDDVLATRAMLSIEDRDWGG